MYLNLQSALKQKNISIRTYTDVIGVKSDNSTQNKLRGRTDFTLTEVMKTIALLPEYDFEWLFTPDDQHSATDHPAS